MPTDITIRIGKPAKRHEQHHEHDGDKEPAGWAKTREPKDEPRATSLSLGTGKWLQRATENSGPKIAPGTGKKP